MTLRQEADGVVITYLMTMNDGEKITDRIDLDAASLVLQRRRFNNLSQSLDYEVSVSNGSVVTRLSDSLSGKHVRDMYASLDHPVFEASVLDYVANVVLSDDRPVVRLPYLVIGDLTGVSWAKAVLKGREQVEIPGGGYAVCKSDRDRVSQRQCSDLLDE